METNPSCGCNTSFQEGELFYKVICHSKEVNKVLCWKIRHECEIFQWINHYFKFGHSITCDLWKSDLSPLSLLLLYPSDQTDYEFGFNAVVDCVCQWHTHTNTHTQLDPYDAWENEEQEVTREFSGNCTSITTGLLETWLCWGFCPLHTSIYYHAFHRHGRTLFHDHL